MADGGADDKESKRDTTNEPLNRKWVRGRAQADGSYARVEQQIRNCLARIEALKKIVAQALANGVRVPDRMTALLFLLFSTLLLLPSFILNEYSLRVLPVPDWFRYLMTVGILVVPVLLFEAIERSRPRQGSAGDLFVLSFAICAFCLFLGVVVLFAALRGQLFWLEMQAAGNGPLPAVVMQLQRLLHYALPALSVALVVADAVMFRAAIADLRHPIALAMREIARLSRNLEYLQAQLARLARLREESPWQGSAGMTDRDIRRRHGLWRAVSFAFPLLVMLSLVALVLFGTSGCSSGGASESVGASVAAVAPVPTTVLIVDESGSVHAPAFQQNLRSAEAILAAAEPGRRYLVLPVLANSWRAPALLDETMPSRTQSGLALGVQEARSAILKKWHDVSASIRADARETDLLGALAAAAEEGGLEIPGSRVIVYSDGLNTVGLRIIAGQPMERDELIRQARARSPWVLSGAPVQFVNAGRGSDPLNLTRRRQFWVDFLADRGAGKVTFAAGADRGALSAGR